LRAAADENQGAGDARGLARNIFLSQICSGFLVDVARTCESRSAEICGARIQPASIQLEQTGADVMSTLITRIYEAYGDALSAVNELKRNQFGSAVHLISLAPNDDTAPGETLEDRIFKAGIPQADVAAFAAAVQQGQSLIVVNAVMGVALKATAILNAHNPRTDAVESKDYYVSTVQRGSPLSSILGLPVLSRDPTPFATFWNMPSLVKSATPLSNFFSIPSLWRQPSSETTLFGFPKLLRSKQTLSSWYNLPLLVNSKRPFNEFFRMPELTSITSPFSAFFRIPCLINESGWDAQVQGVPKLVDSSASLSRFFGWRVLTEKSTPIFPSSGVNDLGGTPAPLSSMLSMPTVLKDGGSLSAMFGIPLLLNRKPRG